MTAQTERLVAGYGGRMLASLGVAWAVLQLGRFLLPPLLPAIIADLGITTVSAGFALGAHGAVYALIQYPSGRLSDRFTRPSLIVPGLAALTLSFLVFAVANTYALFLAGAVALGVGKGLYATPSRAMLSDLFVERRGQALGVYSAGTDVGGLLASLTALVVTGGAASAILLLGVDGTALGWRAPFVPVAATLALVGLAYVRWNREPYRIGQTDVGLVATVERLATTRTQREALVAFSLFYFVVGAWVNFLPTYLAEGKGVTEALAAGLFAVVFLVGIPAKPLGGLASDRVPRRLVGVGGLLLAVGSLVAVVVADSLVGIAAAVGLFALGYKTQFPVADAILLDAAPDANLGGDLGAARALFLAANAIGPVYMGLVATAASYRIAFVGLCACLLAAAGLLWRGL